jgi:hypothetical protein
MLLQYLRAVEKDFEIDASRMYVVLSIVCHVRRVRSLLRPYGPCIYWETVL